MPNFWTGAAEGASKQLQNQQAIGLEREKIAQQAANEQSKLVTQGLITGAIRPSTKGAPGAIAIQNGLIKPDNIGQAIAQKMFGQAPQIQSNYYERTMKPFNPMELINTLTGQNGSNVSSQNQNQDTSMGESIPKSDMGFTGASIDPATGKMKFNIGQTGESKLAQKEAAKMMTAKKQAEGEIRGTISMIDTVWDKADKLIPAQENLQKGMVKGLQRQFGTTSVGKLAGMGDEDAQSFDDFKKGTVSMMIRKLGEKGVLTDKDVERASKFEPAFGDSKKVRNQKKLAMKDFLTKQIAAHYKTSNNSMPTFASEEEALASGYKGDAIIGGQEARID